MRHLRTSALAPIPSAQGGRAAVARTHEHAHTDARAHGHANRSHVSEHPCAAVGSPCRGSPALHRVHARAQDCNRPPRSASRTPVLCFAAGSLDHQDHAQAPHRSTQSERACVPRCNRHVARRTPCAHASRLPAAAHPCGAHARTVMMQPVTLHGGG